MVMGGAVFVTLGPSEETSRSFLTPFSCMVMGGAVFVTLGPSEETYSLLW